MYRQFTHRRFLLPSRFLVVGPCVRGARELQQQVEMELANSEPIYQHALENQRRGSMGWTTALSWPNRPRAVALHALPSPWPKTPNRSATTGGFRMLGVHACELLQKPTAYPGENQPFPSSVSTEFLYPSPKFDLKPDLRELA